MMVLNVFSNTTKLQPSDYFMIFPKYSNTGIKKLTCI